MKAYHEINRESLATALANGLLRTSRGSKGDDRAIIETDHFLDASRPQSIQSRGLSRDNNIYAYVRDGDSIVDIVDGTHIPIKTFMLRSKQGILELDIEPEHCFVSDLDSYDALKAAIETHAPKTELTKLAHNYWSQVESLAGYRPKAIRRPEIMITYDIPPSKLRLMN